MLGRLEVLKIDRVSLRRKIQPTTERAPNALAEYEIHTDIVQEEPSDVSGFRRFNLQFSFRVQLRRAEKWS